MFIVLALATLAATSVAALPVRAARAHRHAAVPARAYRHAGLKSHSIQRSRSPRSGARTGSRVQHQRAAAPRSRARLRGHSIRPRARLVRTSFRHRRVIFMASPLKGSLESLERQNEMTQAEGLERILDEQDLDNRIAEGLLVPVPTSPALAVNTDLPENRRYCRPWTAEFLRDLAREHEARFHRPVEVSSAVRTVEYQKHLMRTNGNAAAAEGDVVSPHLTGATIDIAKRGMTRQELTWMRNWLLPLQAQGLIDVEEEFRQACFHITVYKAYAPGDNTPPSQATPGVAAAAADSSGGA